MQGASIPCDKERLHNENKLEATIRGRVKFVFPCVSGAVVARRDKHCFNSYHRGSICPKEEAELTEEDEHCYKLPSCVTVKT